VNITSIEQVIRTEV